MHAVKRSAIFDHLRCGHKGGPGHRRVNWSNGSQELETFSEQLFSHSRVDGQGQPQAYYRASPK